MPNPDKFYRLIDEGLPRLAALKRAGYRPHKQTAYNLLRQRQTAQKLAEQAEQARQEATRREEERIRAQKIRQETAEAFRLSPAGIAAEAARKAKDPRCSSCGNPLNGPPCGCRNRFSPPKPPAFPEAPAPIPIPPRHFDPRVHVAANDHERALDAAYYQQEQAQDERRLELLYQLRQQRNPDAT
jgi:hypothetical protein